MTFKGFAGMFLIAAGVVALAGCSRKSTLVPYPPIVNPVVFADAFDAQEDFQAFGGSKYDALSIVTDTTHAGSAAAIKIIVPSVNDPAGAYSGGAFITHRARDFSSYNALSFWVRASRPVNLDVCGFGNDNTGSSKFVAQRSAAPITTSWTQVIIPIPDSRKLSNEAGMFYFAEGPQTGVGLTMWLDDIKYVNTASVSNPRPTLATQTINTIVGLSPSLTGTTRTVFAINGVDATVTHLPGYFDFTSTNPAVASVKKGVLSVKGGGSATLTATLAGALVPGAVTVNAIPAPATGPAVPTLPAANVISLLSQKYPNVPVDKWSADWDVADVTDFTVAGTPVKVYTNMVYAGIEFISHTIDASNMTAIHMDLFIPNGTTFKVQLVDFGADGIYNFGGGDDSACELTFNASSTPPVVPGTGQWIPLDIPLTAFTDVSLNSQAHLAQLIISGDTRTVFVDNIYFHK